jgi:hypothetical protein
MSEKISVIATDFDDERIRFKDQPVDGLIDKIFRVLRPGVRKRREASVFGEDVLRRDQGRYLQQQAVLAQPQVEGKRRFGKVEFVYGEEFFTWRSRTEV